MVRKVTREKATKKKATRRKATKKKATRKKATKKKATRKKATKKKATRKKATKKKTTRKKATKKKTTRKKVTRKKATRKKATKKKATRKKATKKKAKKKRKVNPAFVRPLTPSASLANVIGSKAIPRTQAIKKLWDYIKKNKLQNPDNRRNILADAKLKDLFGKNEVTMFELTKIVSKHLD